MSPPFYYYPYNFINYVSCFEAILEMIFSTSEDFLTYIIY